MRRCHSCDGDREFLDTTPGPLMAALFVLISFGLYLVPLLIMAIRPDKRNVRCTTCGEIQDMRGNPLGNSADD